ncbi:MAG TPA: ATP-binding protein [Acidimicrobiia bacterium]|nr:ATP-binding protein [Acidimicrobiia bacterium]
MTSDQRTFPNSPRSVTGARQFVLGTIRGVAREVADSVALMVSELATNSLRHAGTGFQVRVDRSSEEVHVEVIDRGGGVPAVRSPAPSDASGRGLRIVQDFADSWGVRSSPPGKTVWFTLALH